MVHWLEPGLVVVDSLSSITVRGENNVEDVRELLGRPKIHPERAAKADQIGVATGMFYTPVGGDIMFVEASPMAGKGELVLTGQLGDVMKESARAAWTYATSRSPWPMTSARSTTVRPISLKAIASSLPEGSENCRT